MDIEQLKNINDIKTFIKFLKEANPNLVLKLLEETNLPSKTKEIIKYRCIEERSFKETCLKFSISAPQQHLILRKAFNKIKMIVFSN